MVKDGTCATFRPTRADFQKPFSEYVVAIFAKNPELPCFKVTVA